MFCPECGYKNVDGAAFCENCGTKLTGMPGNINPKETSYKKTGEKATKKSVSLGKINKMLLIDTNRNDQSVNIHYGLPGKIQRQKCGRALCGRDG